MKTYSIKLISGENNLTTYAIQVLNRENNTRSELIHGTAETLSDILSSSVDNDSHKLSQEDYVLVILETDKDGNQLSAFSRKPLVTVDTFLTILQKEQNQ